MGGGGGQEVKYVGPAKEEIAQGQHAVLRGWR